MRKTDVLKRVLPLPELLVRLGLFTHPPGEGNHKCPLHQESKGAAFSISRRGEAWLWNCNGACNVGGDEVTLIERHLQLPRWGAMRQYAALCGVNPAAHWERQPESEPRQGVAFPQDLRSGGRSELETVAALRKVDFWAVATMQQNGVLQFGTVCGEACWIVTDASRLCAEARRMDGSLFPARGNLGQRKTHTLGGSKKNWPVGLLLPAGLTACFKKVLWVEGSGDLVAAYHFALIAGNWLPVALLGAGLKRLHPTAETLLRGKQVRLVPHVDPAGKTAAKHWATLLQKAGCTIDGFNLGGLRKRDGVPVKDLNDATDLVEAEAHLLKSLLA